MSKDINILFHVPRLHSYRAPVLYNLSKLVNILPITDNFDYSLLDKKDIIIIRVKQFKKDFHFSKKTIVYRLFLKLFLSNMIYFCSLDSKRLDLILAGIICKLRGKLFVFHSHCLYKRNKNDFLANYLIKIVINYFWYIISNSVFSYGEKSRRYFYLNKKVRILENRF